MLNAAVQRLLGSPEGLCQHAKKDKKSRLFLSSYTASYASSLTQFSVIQMFLLYFDVQVMHFILAQSQVEGNNFRSKKQH